MARCRACQERAISLDPNFAAAHAGMAEYYFLLAMFLNARPREVMPQALAAAERALELDPECAEAYSIRGSLRAGHEYKWTEALDDFNRALTLNPGPASALHRRGSWCYRFLGRLEEAAADIRRGIELDPLSAWPRTSEPLVLYFFGRKAEAVQRAREVLELFPFPRVAERSASPPGPRRASRGKTLEIASRQELPGSLGTRPGHGGGTRIATLRI